MQFANNPNMYLSVAQNAYRLRGYFINEIIVLERLMERVIANYYTDDTDKQFDLIEMVFATKWVSFEGKRRMLKHLLEEKEYCKDLHKANPSLISDLKKIEGFRNVLAHNILDTSEASIENAKKGIVGFLEILNSTVLITYDNDQIEDFKKLVAMYQTSFIIVLNDKHVSPSQTSPAPEPTNPQQGKEDK